MPWAGQVGQERFVGVDLGPDLWQERAMLTEEEMAAGWRLLFDGETPAGWRGYRQEGFPAGWRVEEGTLHFPGSEAAGGAGGDIITVERFADFELALEWRLAPRGNSGIFIRVQETPGWSWETGPEMQVLDDPAYGPDLPPEERAGSNYALHAPAVDVLRPAGHWNAVRIVVHGAHVEHWMNGAHLLSYELLSEDWERRVAASKFAAMPGYGRSREGHLGLQDHGDPVWYRNIRVRTR